MQKIKICELYNPKDKRQKYYVYAYTNNLGVVYWLLYKGKSLISGNTNIINIFLSKLLAYNLEIKQ